MTYFVLGIIFLQVAYMTFTGTQPVTFLNEQGQVVGTRDLTVLFRVISWSALLMGFLLLVIAARRLFTKEQDQERSTSRPVGFMRRLFWPSPIWSVFNTMLIPLGLWAGYAELAPSSLHGTNPDIILCISILALMPIFVIATVSLAADKRLQTPAWNRFPLNWRKDPLQALFITSLCMFAAMIGSLFRLGSSGVHGFWTFAIFASLFLGLLVAQAIVYWAYRDRIANSEPRC